MSQDGVYGYPCVTNPNDFTPDGECCSPEEIAAHKLACEMWGKPGYVPNKGCYTERSEDGQFVKHVTRTSWGIGFNLVLSCDSCRKPAFEPLMTCYECGQEFCVECWPSHNEPDTECR